MGIVGIDRREPPAFEGSTQADSESLWWLQLLDRSCRQPSIPRHPGNRNDLKGVNQCAHSKHFFPPPSWLLDWRLRRPHRLRFPSPSAFSPSVRTAITDMRHISARPWAITARGTSITASSWAWAHGVAGAIATAGASTASATTAAGATMAAAATGPMPASAAADLRRGPEARQCAAAAVAADMPVHRLLMQHLRVAAVAAAVKLTAAAVVKCTVAAVAAMQQVAADMPAAVADTGNTSRRRGQQRAKPTSFALCQMRKRAVYFGQARSRILTQYRSPSALEFESKDLGGRFEKG